jgi:hypothetical protein
MTHSKCGLLLLLAMAGVAACGGDPTDSFRQGNEQIVATPTSLFLQQGASVFVIAELQDEQGNQLTEDLQTANVGPEITVLRDTAFLETTNGTELKTRERFIVTGLAPGASSFTIKSGADTLFVPVRVVPTSVSVTFSNASPGVNEPMTITAPAGYKFGADAGVATATGGVGFVTGFSADSTAVSVIIPPGTTGALTVSGLQADFLPGVSLSLPSIDTVAAGTTPLAGTGSTATAPTIPVPPLDGTTNFFDAGAFTAPDITGDGGVGAQYYKIVVTEAGNYHFVTNWAGGSDLDAVVCSDAACNTGAFAGTGITQPEDGTLALTPGTYYYSVVLFAGSPPGYFALSLTHEAPPTE